VRGVKVLLAARAGFRPRRLHAQRHIIAIAEWNAQRCCRAQWKLLIGSSLFVDDRAASPMSAFGTKQTSRECVSDVRFGGKATLPKRPLMSAFDPKRTLGRGEGGALLRDWSNKSETMDFLKVSLHGSRMLHQLGKTAPWIFVYVVSVVVLISATRAARDCLVGRQLSGISNIRVGVVHRAGTRFWGLYCERVDILSLRPAIY